MKKKHGIILICAALALISGCSETTIDPNSSGWQSSESSDNSQFNVPNNSESNSDESSDMSSEPSIEDKNITVSANEVLEINENITCEEGEEIRIEKGGVLKLNSELDLSGDLYVEGKLDIGEDAVISGSGVIHVINSFDDIDCKGTVTAKIDAPDPVEIDGVTYVGGILLVNKKYALPRTYGDGLCPEVTEAIEAMRKDSGFTMSLRGSSGYRSYETQEWWYNYYCERDGVEAANKYSAVPGHSEHQAGLAADITSTEFSYANTAEGKWLAANCYKYGLIIRYPEDKVDITGYVYEPWHVRYVGKSNAKLIHDSGLCLEEFLEVDG